MFSMWCAGAGPHALHRHRLELGMSTLWHAETLHLCLVGIKHLALLCESHVIGSCMCISSHAVLFSFWYFSRYLAAYPLAVSCAVSGGAPMARVLCPRSSSVPLPYGHPDVTICLNHPFCSCLNILIDLMSYVKDL